jgi:hypothetical protein
MADSLSAEQIRSQAIDRMGSELGEHYFGLFQEVSWICRHWTQFRELFALSH